LQMKPKVQCTTSNLVARNSWAQPLSHDPMGWLVWELDLSLLLM
jgi:hypothetical protein